MKTVYEVYVGQDGREFRDSKGNLRKKNGYDAWLEKTEENKDVALSFAAELADKYKKNSEEYFDIVYVTAQAIDEDGERLEECESGISTDPIFHKTIY